jgi:endonuclease/exonuclease/phosphatase family metal-dependent hydrolase
MTDDTPHKPEPSEDAPALIEPTVAVRPWRILRKQTPIHRLGALLLAATCLGAISFFIIYRWPWVSWPVAFVTLLPAFGWFGGLFCGLVVGAYFVRKRWILIACAIWLLCFISTEEIVQIFKFWSGSAQRNYSSFSVGYEAYMAAMPPANESVEIPLRIVSWNVAKGQFGADKAVGVLEDLRPDILFLQEYTWGSDAQMNAPLRNSPIFRGYHYSGERAGPKVPVVSRYPIRWLGPEDSGQRRTYAIYEMRVHPGLRIYLINLYIKHLRGGLPRRSFHADIANLRQTFINLREEVTNLSKDGPVIIAGDFNTPANYGDFHFLKGYLKDAFVANGFGLGKTAPTLRRKRPFPALVRIDMIWVPKEAEVFRTIAIPTPYSDHAIVLAEVAVPATVRYLPGERGSEGKF